MVNPFEPVSGLNPYESGRTPTLSTPRPPQVFEFTVTPGDPCRITSADCEQYSAEVSAGGSLVAAAVDLVHEMSSHEVLDREDDPSQPFNAEVEDFEIGLTFPGGVQA